MILTRSISSWIKPEVKRVRKWVAEGNDKASTYSLKVSYKFKLLEAVTDDERICVHDDHCI
jgi:hypothetical protein